jgi:DNA-binding transcriptional ArsR family regulator
MAAPKRDEKALKTLARHLKREPHTIEEIMGAMDVAERTAYRWLKYLEDEGYDVVSRRNEKNEVLYSVLAEPAKPKPKAPRCARCKSAIGAETFASKDGKNFCSKSCRDYYVRALKKTAA